jgi:hypothetical protein
MSKNQKLSLEQAEELKLKLLTLKSQKQYLSKKLLDIETEIGYINVCLQVGKIPPHDDAL